MIDNLLVKPVGPDCNLRCDYCFYLKKKDDLYPGKNRMSLETAERMISQLMEQENPVTFSWQGGEPTLIGLDFFKEIIKLQKKFGNNGQKISNTIQTNGTLIDENWAEFFSEYNFLVGLSLDGPEKLHNAYRKYPNGQGTFDEVVEAGQILKDWGIPINILTTVNDKTVKKPDEILDFLLSKNFDYFQFLPTVETENGKLENFCPKPREFGKFLDKIFHRWIEDFPPKFNVRFFDALIEILLGKTPSLCKLDDKCGRYLVVENNGDVYPCDFFVEPSEKLGNIRKRDIKEISESEKFRKFRERKSNFGEDCKSCDFLEFCHGGCPKYRGINEERKTYFCDGLKFFFSRNLEDLERISEKYKKAQSL